MSKLLDAVNENVKAWPFDIIRLSEIHNGNEPETLEYMSASPCQNCYSMAKTFTMVAIGLLYDKGLIKPEDKICEILKDEIPEGTDKRWFNSTVDMALSHRLGLPGGFLDIDCNRSTDFTDDYLKYLFLYPLAYDPGTEERYSDGAFYLLSCIVEKISGMTLDNFLWKELLVKLEFQEMAFSHCPKGHAMGATGLYLHSSDVVKIAWLLLNRGKYKEKRYLSEEWCEIAFSRHYALDCNEDETVFYKGGMFGQKMMIFPKQNRVACLQAFGANSDTVMKFILNYKGE